MDQRADQLLPVWRGTSDLHWNPKRTQQRCHRQFAATVDTNIQYIFGIKFKIKPRTTVGNNAGMQNRYLPDTWRFTAIMVKEHTR
jgi:hypothetical protein